MTAVTAMRHPLIQIGCMRELRFGFLGIVIGVLAFTLAVMTLVLRRDGDGSLLVHITRIGLTLGVVALIMTTVAATRGEDKRLCLVAFGFALVSILIPFVFAILSFFGGALILVAVIGAVVACAF